MVYGGYGRGRRLNCGCYGRCSCGPSLVQEIIGAEMVADGARDGNVGEELLGLEAAEGRIGVGEALLLEQVFDNDRPRGYSDDRGYPDDDRDYPDDDGGYPGGGDISWP